MKSTQNLPTRLKGLRKKNQYSQEYVAEQLNISRQAISHWENGKAYPDIDNLLLLAELYHITLDELLNVEAVKEEQSTPSWFQNNLHILEMLGISVIILLSMLFPFVPIIFSVFVTLWMRKTGRKYSVIYLLCCICFIIGVYNSFVFITHFTFDYGTPIIKQI